MKRPALLAPALLLLAGAAAYCNSFHGPLVMDDVWSIRDNPTLRHLWPLTAVLKPIPGGITVSGRPLLNLSLALNYAVSGLDVWSYHALNLAIHLLAGLALFGLVRRTLAAREAVRRSPAQAGEGRPALLAFSIALLWIVHPLQTEAVTYIIQRAESMTALFCLVTLYGFVRFAAPPAGEAPARGWACLSVAACLLGMFAKELMAVVPVLVLCFDRAFVAGTFAGAWRARKPYYLALFATWVPLALLMAHTGSRDGTVGFGLDVTPWSYALIQVQAVTRYLGLAFWPHPLVFDYGVLSARSAGDVLPYALVLVPLIVATLVGFVRNRWWAYAGVWFAVILAPTSSFIPGNRQTMAEHRMYLPLAAVLALAVLGIDRLFRGRAFRTAAACSVLAVALGAATFARNRDYSSSLSLYEGAIAAHPDDAYAQFGVAAALSADRRFQEALDHVDAALRLDDHDVHFHLNRAYDLLGLNRPAEAVASFAEAFKRGAVTPEDEEAFGRTLVSLDRAPEAIRYLEEAVRLQPANPAFLVDLGDAYFKTGRLPDSIREYAAAVAGAQGPVALHAHASLADALAMSRRFDEATAQYRAALALRPDLPSLRSNLGAVLLAMGRTADAIPELREAVRLRPNYAKTRVVLGEALAASGDLKAAASELEAALAIDPSNAEAKEALAQVKAP